MAFSKPAVYLTIGSLDDSDLSVEAQYNPKDLQIVQPIKWDEHTPLHGQKSDALALEFGAMQAQTTKVELFFDGYERRGWIDEETIVMDQINQLKQLASVIDPNSADPEKRRPHYCVLTWGEGEFTMKPLRCIIDNVTVTYQAFSPFGEVLRATVALSLKEANHVNYLAEVKAAAAAALSGLSDLADRMMR